MSYNVFSTAHDLAHIKHHIINPSPLPVITTNTERKQLWLLCTYIQIGKL